MSFTKQVAAALIFFSLVSVGKLTNSKTFDPLLALLTFQ